MIESEKELNENSIEKYCLVGGDTIEQKEDNLRKKIEEIEIFYCDEKYQKQPENNRINFSEIFFKESEILRKIQSFLKEKHEEEKIEEIKKEIDVIYDKNIGARTSPEIMGIDYFLSRVDDYKEFENYLEKQEAAAGVLPESQTKSDARIDFLELSFCKAEAEEFRRIGLSLDDEVAEFAFGDIFPGKDKFNEDIFKSALAKMAEFLKDKRPECKAVYAESWFFDGTKWGDLLGFHVFKDKILHNNWGQFVDKYSNVNWRRLKRMIDNGEMPYKNYFGYLRTEEFIERFLNK